MALASSSPASAASAAPSSPAIAREARDPEAVSVSGAGLGIVVNANAKRGGRRIAVELGRALPGARVRLTRSTDELDGFLRSLLRADEPKPRCILAAGGDGTAVALVNALRRVLPEGEPYPPIGLLPLGTGNAWAHSTGAIKLGLAVRQLRTHMTSFPTRRFGLIECEGVLTTFAGCGWDAEVLNDYKAQVDAAKGPSRRLAKTVYGYLAALLMRTVPKTLVNGRPHVLVENLGPEVLRMTPAGRIVPLEGATRGTVLYDGPMGVAGCATCPEFGYQFRAYPHAERLPGTFNVRVLNVPPLRAVQAIPRLWVGTPIAGIDDWFASEVRMTFSRPVPLQIAGDAVGFRQSVDYRMHDRTVDVLDWRAIE